MISISYAVALLLSIVPFAASAPAPVSSASAQTSASDTGTAAPAYATVAPISLNPNQALWNGSVVETPQAIRGPLGATVIGPTNAETVKQNPDLLAPPTTDNGNV